MGKSIHITLPNGRGWTKKGDAARHFREMLNRYAVGERVQVAADHSDLVALLTIYDADMPLGNPTKSGSGIVYFEKNIDQDHQGQSTCFFVVRSDGTRIDFSLGRALDAASRQAE
jgi:hypothetical protein